MRRFEFRDGGSSKFWEICRTGTVVSTCWGRIGSAGQQKEKDHGSEAKAESQMVKQIQKKVAKGYVEQGTDRAGGASPAVVSAPSAVDATSGVLEDGGTVEVPGSGGRTYTLSRNGGVYACTCPAWRHQSLPLDLRSCKHLRRFRGEEAEAVRVGAAPARRTTSSSAENAPALLLAHKWEGTDPTGWWMSEKLDGVRAYWNGTSFVSRQGNAYLAPDWFVADLPPIPLDGELFGGRGCFQDTVSVARSIQAGEQWRGLTYVIFDAPEVPGGFEERMAVLARHAEVGWAHARVLEQTRCTSLEMMNEELARVLALQGEGLMLRKPGSLYASGRSETLLKVKQFHDAEARVVGHQPGTGRHLGRLGALEAELPDGTRFKIGTGFSDSEREDPPAVGAIVTFRYQELTRAGVPRFPVFLRERRDVTWPGDPQGTALTPTPAPAPVLTASAAVASSTPASAPSSPAVADASGVTAERYELVAGSSAKFWEVRVEQSCLHLTWGRIGTKGQRRSKDLGSVEAARSERDKLVRAKTRKGYQRVTPDV